MTRAVYFLYRFAFWIFTGVFAWSATVHILRAFGILDGVLLALKMFMIIVGAILLAAAIASPLAAVSVVFGGIIAVIWGIIISIYYGLKRSTQKNLNDNKKGDYQQETHQYYGDEYSGVKEEYSRVYEQPEQKPYITMPSSFEEACVVLGTQPGLDRESYKRIWRKEALRYHPDKTRDLWDRLQVYAEEEMKRINKAWEIIKSTI